MVKKIAIKAVLCYQWRKGLNAKAASKEINDVVDPGTVNMVQNWFRCFMQGDTRLKDKSGSFRYSVLEVITWNCWTTAKHNVSRTLYFTNCNQSIPQ